MAEDTRDFIEQTQSRARDYTGQELSNDELVTNFARLGIDARVAALQQIEAESADAEYSTVAEAAKGFTSRSALRAMHERLRKIGR